MNTKDQEVLSRIENFKIQSQEIMSDELDSWLRADDLYDQQFDDEEDRANLYNPSMMFDIVQRVVSDLKLTDYLLRIPGSDDVEKQVIRDYISQVEEGSGLTSLIRDDDKGALSWAYLGNVFLTWGKADNEMIKRGIPIKFDIVRLTQAFFPRHATRIRDYNGNPEATECLFVFQDSTDKVKKMFDVEFMPGKLPFSSDYDVQQSENDIFADDDITEYAKYYNIDKGQYYVIIGPEKVIAEKYDDNNSSIGKYPFKYNGKNVLPVEQLKSFPVIGRFYAKGLYHKFAKIVRNDARRRNLAQAYAEQNIFPDRFIKMSDDRYSEFINDLSINRELIEAGERSYVRISPEENIEVGDLRTGALSNEFERMKQDDIELVTQGGIAIRDVDRPASQTATATAAEEAAKTRLADYIIKINAGASMFLRQIILDYIKRYIKKDNDTPVATNASVKSTGSTIEVVQKLGTVTCGDIVDYLDGDKALGIPPKQVYIQEDFSAWDNIGMKMRRIRAGLGLAAGLPAQLRLQRQALGTLGFDAFNDEVTQINQPQNAPQNSGGIQLPQEQIAL